MNALSHDVYDYGSAYEDDALWNKSITAASQIELEARYAKSQLDDAMRQDFLNQFEADLIHVVSIMTGVPEGEYILEGDLYLVSFLADLMAQAAIRKRAPISVFVGVLARHFRGRKDEEGNFIDPYQTCADAIAAAAHYDVVTLAARTLPGSNEEILEVILKFDATPQTRARVEQFQYPLPMIEPPLPCRTNRDTGYRTIKGSLILKRNHHDEDICLDHINRMNAVPLSVNADVLAFIQNSWKNLDKPKPGEPFSDYQKRKKAFQHFDRTSRDVLAAMMLHGRFHLTHKYDKRGRTYSQGYHCNYQGNDWSKAIVQLAEPEHLNEE